MLQVLDDPSEDNLHMGRKSLIPSSLVSKFSQTKKTWFLFLFYFSSFRIDAEGVRVPACVPYVHALWCVIWLFEG